MNKQLWQQIFQYAFAALVAIGLYWVTYFAFLHKIPEGNKDAMLILLGVVAAAFTQVVSYFFGSSRGSAQKDEMLRNNKKPE